MNRTTIQARRDTLTAEQERMELAYARAEEQIKALQHDVALRQRDLDVRSGAIRELDQLLAEPEEERAQAGSVADDRGNRAVARAWVRARAWWEGWRGR